MQRDYATLDRAKAELSNPLPREVFLVRNLFKGYEWNRIYRSGRLLLGTLFLNYIKTDDIGVVPILSQIRKRMPLYLKLKSYIKITMRILKIYTDYKKTVVFGDNAEKVKAIVLETIEMVHKKEEATKIIKALTTLRNLTIGVSGSLIASGIVALITKLPIW
mgnify:CR=1 FL=1